MYAHRTMNKDKHTDFEIRKFYDLRNIAVVGMSKNEEKPAHLVPKFLLEHGYNIIPVNPTTTDVLGRKSYPSVSEIPYELNIDIVDVFRRSEDVPMQLGISNEEAEKKAKENGIDVVYNRCMLEEYERLFN